MAPETPEPRPAARDRAPHDDARGDAVSARITAAQLRRRRDAAWRLPPLGDGQRDPLDQLAAGAHLTEPEDHDMGTCSWCYSWRRTA